MTRLIFGFIELLCNPDRSIVNTHNQKMDGAESGAESGAAEETERSTGIQTDSPRQCFANQVWTVQRTTDLRLRQERDIVRNSMARLEVKSFVTKCLKPLGSIIG